MVLRKGQMIIEVIVAFTIMVVGLIAVLQLSRKSVSTSGVANRAAIATSYANEAMEWVRNEERIDRGDGEAEGWQFIYEQYNDCPRDALEQYCLGSLNWDGCDNGAGCGSSFISNTEYTRRMEMGYDIPNSRIYVKVVVGWNEGNRSEAVNRTYEFVKK